jgi:hypothetical protein
VVCSSDTAVAASDGYLHLARRSNRHALDPGRQNGLRGREGSGVGRHAFSHPRDGQAQVVAYHRRTRCRHGHDPGATSRGGAAACGRARNRWSDRAGDRGLCVARTHGGAAERHRPCDPAHRYAGGSRHLDARDHSRHPGLASPGGRLRGAKRRTCCERGHLHHLCLRHRGYGAGDQSRRRDAGSVARPAIASRRATATARQGQ